MKRYNFDTLLKYLFSDLTFSSRVLVHGDWTWREKDFERGSHRKVFFYLERMAKKDIRQIEKLNNTELLEDIVIETYVFPISHYKQLCQQEKKKNSWKVREYYLLRDDFEIFSWEIYSSQVIILLNYVLTRLKLPKRCAVVLFNYSKEDGILFFKDLEVLFVFEKLTKRLVSEAGKLGKMKFPNEIGTIHVSCLDIENYEKFLSGKLDFYDEEVVAKDTAIVLYDAFHKKRLKAPFIKATSDKVRKK